LNQQFHKKTLSLTPSLFPERGRKGVGSLLCQLPSAIPIPTDPAQSTPVSTAPDYHTPRTTPAHPKIITFGFSSRPNPARQFSPRFPSTFNLQPSTFNLQPSTFNLQPSTFNLKPSTFNLKPVFPLNLKT
jgi:hypothetical protein